MTATKDGVAGRRSALLLVIDETVYGVRRLRDTADVGDPAFRLRKPDGTLYDVLQTRHGRRCDCPDFIFRRDGIDPKGCKHVRALVEAGLFGDGEPEPTAADAPPRRRAAPAPAR